MLRPTACLRCHCLSLTQAHCPGVHFFSHLKLFLYMRSKTFKGDPVSPVIMLSK